MKDSEVELRRGTQVRFFESWEQRGTTVTESIDSPRNEKDPAPS